MSFSAARSLRVPDPEDAPVPRGIAPAALQAALPDLALGATCLLVWIWPGLFLRGTVRWVVALMVLEFIVVHSAAVMGHVAFEPGDRRQRLRKLRGLAGLYSVFALGFSLAFMSPWPLLSFWGLMANRLLAVTRSPAPAAERRGALQRDWIVCMVFYIVGAFTTSLLPIPRLGVTHALVAEEGIPGDGLWVDQPWRVVAFGFLYFTAVGLSELRENRWVKEMTPRLDRLMREGRRLEGRDPGR